MATKKTKPAGKTAARAEPARTKAKPTAKQARAKQAAPKPTKPKPSPAGGNTVVALLRGINVGGNKRVPMAELSLLAERLGCTGVETYIQSGNLVVTTALSPAALEAALEQAIAERFGFTVEVIARTAEQWKRYAAATHFADAARERPKLLHLGVSKQKPKSGAVADLEPYAKAGERVKLDGDALWIDFMSGVARSKLTPAVLDRAVGSTVTARNFRTVQQLWEMMRARLA